MITSTNKDRISILEKLLKLSRCCSETTTTTTTTTTENTFDTILEFSASEQDSAEGIVATISAPNDTTEFHFNAIAMPIGDANTMEIYLSVVLRMVVDFPDEYLGEGFKYIHNNGTIYFGTFVNGQVNF